MKIKTLSRVTIFLLFFTTIAFAAARDFSTMTIEELANMRNQIQSLPAEERAAFQQEWQKRIQGMTLEERQKYGLPGPMEPGRPNGPHNGSIGPGKVSPGRTPPGGADLYAPAPGGPTR